MGAAVTYIIIDINRRIIHIIDPYNMRRRAGGKSEQATYDAGIVLQFA